MPLFLDLYCEKDEDEEGGGEEWAEKEEYEKRRKARKAAEMAEVKTIMGKLVRGQTNKEKPAVGGFSTCSTSCLQSCMGPPTYCTTAFFYSCILLVTHISTYRSTLHLEEKLLEEKNSLPSWKTCLWRRLLPQTAVRAPPAKRGAQKRPAHSTHQFNLLRWPK